jgi:hypothetical protein
MRDGALLRRRCNDAPLGSEKSPRQRGGDGIAGIDHAEAVLDVVDEAGRVRGPQRVGGVVLCRRRREDALHVAVGEQRIGLEDERHDAGDDGARVRGTLILLNAAAASCRVARDVPVVGVRARVAARRGDEERRARRRVIRVQAELVGRSDGHRVSRLQKVLLVDVLAPAVLVARREDVHDAAPAAPLKDAALQQPQVRPGEVGEGTSHPEVRPRGAFKIGIIVGAILAVRPNLIRTFGRRRRPAGTGAHADAARARLMRGAIRGH